MQTYRTIRNHKVLVDSNLALSSNSKHLNLNTKLKAKEILTSSPKQTNRKKKKNASICVMNVELILIQMANVPRYHIFLRL